MASEQRGNRRWHALSSFAAGSCLFVWWCGAPLRADEPPRVGVETSAERRARIEQMSPHEKQQLGQKKERFENLTEAERRQIRSLHSELATREDGSQLREIALRYAEWLKTLTPKERADLLASPPSERLEQIRRLKEKQQAERVRELVKASLKPEDIRSIFAWLGEYAEAHEGELLAMLDSEAEQNVRRIPDPVRRRMWLFRALQWRPDKPRLPRPTDAELESLRNRLSPDARQVFDGVADVEKKLPLVLTWVQAAAMTRAPHKVSREELEKFISERLDRRERDRLDQMPREQMEQELTRMYWAHKFRNRQGEFRPPPFWRPDGRPGRHRGGDGPPHTGGRRPPYRDRPGPPPGHVPGQGGPGPPGPPLAPPPE
jgi:hypothetical protein